MVVSLATSAEITATWSINGETVQDGVTLEGFKEIVVTFSGTDHLGRKVDGVEVTKVYPLISSIETFFKVAEDGSTTPVPELNNDYNGCLSANVNACVTTLKLHTNAEYKVNDAGEYRKKGNYRIVLPGAKVQLQPKIDNNNVWSEQDFVFNFTIANEDIEEEEETPDTPGTDFEMPAFTANPADKSTVSEIAEITVTFDCPRIAINSPMTGPNQETWPFLNQVLLNDAGEVTASMPVSPLMCEQIDANVVKFFISPMVSPEGVTEWTTPGTYSVTVPANLIMFSETDFNTPFTLYYTIAEGEEPGEEEIVVTTMEELKANAGKRVLYKGLEPVVVEEKMGFWVDKFYYMPDGETNLTFPMQYFVKPAKMDVYGTYNAEYVEYPGMEPVPTFVVENNEDVVAVYAFNTVVDLADFVNEIATPEQKTVAYDIVEPVVVSLAMPHNPSMYYIQYEVDGGYMGVMAIAGGNGGIAPFNAEEGAMPYMPTTGDKIKVKGTYVPMSSEYDENYNITVTETATFVVESATLIEANQELNITRIKSGDYLGAQRAALSGSYVALLDGQVVEKDGSYYYERLNMDYATGETFLDSILVEQAGDIDLSEASDFALCGILAFDTYEQDFVLYAVEFKDFTLYAENLAEMLEFGKTNDAGDVCILKNPVLVTYVDANDKMVVEDATSTALVNLNSGIEKAEVGFYLTGLVGVPGEDNGCLKVTDVNGAKLVKGEEGTITPIEVTIKDLIADREAETSQYALKVVSIKDITFDFWMEDEDGITDAYLVQNNGEALDSIFTNVKTWRRLGIAVPEVGEKIESMVCIADIYSMTSGVALVTVQPLNAESVVVEKQDEPTNVEYAEIGNIYTENGLIVAEGEFQIFTVTGQNVTDMNGNLANGVYVVRTANATAKVVIK